jgi:quercetin dioxygenase-like cupin family protein
MKLIAHSVLALSMVPVTPASQMHAQASAAIAPREKIQAAFSGEPPNAPGMVLTGTVAEYKPGAWTPPHSHGDAFAMVYVLSGSIVSKVDDGKERVYHAGESFTENPHAHHILFLNPSKTESTKIYAVFLAPKSEKDLVILDKH